MIFRLIQLEEYGWKALLALWAFGCLFAFVFFPSSGRPLMGFDSGILVGSFLTVFPSSARPRCSLLQASLPIRGRDIFAFHLFLSLIVCWGFNFTMVAAAALESHLNLADYALDTSAIASIGLLARHSVRMREYNLPQSWKWIVGLVTWAALVSALGMHFQPEPAIAPIYVLPACTFAAVALFWTDWASFPRSFEVAPREPVAPKPAKSSLPLPAFWPLLRAFLGKGRIVLLCLLFVFGCIGTLFFGIVCIFLSCFATIVRLRTTHQWLFPLPISRQKLFAAMILPPVGFFSLGGFIAMCFSWQSPGEVILSIATVAAASLLALFVLEMPSLVRVGTAWTLLLPFAAFVALAWSVWLWCPPATSITGKRIPPIEAILGNALPDRLPLLIVVTVMGLAVLYWLAYTGFRRLQVKPQRLTTLS